MVDLVFMRRSLRIAEGNFVYHVLNRGNPRRTFLHKSAYFAAFVRVLAEAKEQLPMRILAYCLLPNYWHLLVWPLQISDLSRFIGRLTLTHAQGWHGHYHNVGTSHLYKGRFKSFPVQEVDHYLTVCRYVERRLLGANRVERTQDWRWSS
jgi:putative transposase